MSHASAGREFGFNRAASATVASDALKAATQKLILAGAKRGIDRIRTRAGFSLPGQVQALLGMTERPFVAVLTGFPIRTGDGTVVFENDGPLGAAMMAAAFSAIGWKTCLITDRIAEPIFFELLKLMPSNAEFPVEVKFLGKGGATAAQMKSGLKKQGVSHLISIERPGAARDQEYYNMRAETISRIIVPADSLVIDAPWTTAAYADGGNEIGMGNIGLARISKNVENGMRIASRTKVDFLTLCGVSNWGAYGLLSYLSVARPDLKPILFRYLSVAFDKKLFAAAKRGGAVDGVTREQTRTVDNMPLEMHHKKIEAFRNLTERFIADRTV